MSNDRFEVSRRDVLRGAGVAAILGAAAPALAQEGAKQSGIRRLGPEPVPIACEINGARVAIKVEPRVTLLDALRDTVGLTGTKRICDGGACGGCTVIVNGLTVNSCMMLAVDAAGSKIRTIEGLERDGKLHAVQDAFITHDALQCGFCTPGMILSCTALVESNAQPSEEQIREAVAGNLCRCGTYPHVFAACRSAAASVKESAR
jgi:aerobic-type carbon monoxide dehydrogenase small subunit (CoxS/CutS family)